MTFVLDASAVLALLNSEPGAEVVAARLDQSILCAVNLIEIATRLIDGGVPLEETQRTIALLDLTVVPFDTDLAYAAAALRHPTRPLGLSLADPACLALAVQTGATALTADRAWTKLKLDCPIELIR